MKKALRNTFPRKKHHYEKKAQKNFYFLKTHWEDCDVHVWGTYMYMYTKYEVSISTLCQEEVCTDTNANDYDVG